MANDLVRPVLDCLCLLHVAKDLQEGLRALNRCSVELTSILKLEQGESCPGMSDVELCIRLFQTIFKQFRPKVVGAIETQLQLDRACVEFLLALMPVFSSRLEKDLRRVRKRHEDNSIDLRPNALSLASYLVDQVQDRQCRYTVFCELISRLRWSIERLYRVTRDFEEETVRAGSQYFLALLAALGDVEDIESRFEQQLVRHFQELGPFEKDLWAIGVLQNWIRFT